IATIHLNWSVCGVPENSCPWRWRAAGECQRAAPAGLVTTSTDCRDHPRLPSSQATEKRCAGRTVGSGVLSVVAPRDTFTGVGVGRKAGSEAGEAIRWGHFLSRRLGVGSPRHVFDIGPPLARGSRDRTRFAQKGISLASDASVLRKTARALGFYHRL